MRRWILVTASGCFAAGMSAGFALPGIAAACCGGADAGDPVEVYVRRFTVDYRLTSAQQKSLRAVLQRRHEDELKVFTDYQDLPPTVRQELENVRRMASQRTRALLDPRQRLAYDRDLETGSQELQERK